MINRENKNVFMLTVLYIGYTFTAINTEIVNSRVSTGIQYLIVIIVSAYYIYVYTKKSYVGNAKFIITKPSSIEGKGLLILWSLFSISIIISQISHEKIPITGFVYLLHVSILFFYLIPMVLDKPIESIIKAALFSGLFYLILSFIMMPINFSMSYMGVFSNPNRLGLITLQVNIASLSLLIENINQSPSKKMKSSYVFLIYVFSFFILLLTRSRTAFFGAILSILIALVIGIVMKKIKISKLIFPGIIFIVIYFVYLRDFFLLNIVEQTLAKGEGRVLSGREIRWETALNDVTILGHGDTYFTDLFGSSAHNSIINYLGHNGIFASFFLTIFLLLLLVSAFKYSVYNRKEKYFFVPLIFVSSFTAIAMFETLILPISISITMIFYNIIGVIIFRKYKVKN